MVVLIRALQHLVKLTARAHSARLRAEAAYELLTTRNATKETLGILSAELSFTEEDAAEAVRHWAELHSNISLNLEEVNQ